MNLNDILNLLGNENNDDSSKKPSFDVDRFKLMIDKYGMKCKYEIGEKNGETIIIEDWSSETNKSIKINRIYPFSINHVDLIDINHRKEVLNQLLEKCVSEENYETAAELRDVIFAL